MSYEIRLGDKDFDLKIVARRPHLRVARGETIYQVEDIDHGPDHFEIRVDGRVFRGRRSLANDAIEIRLNGQTFVFRRRSGVHANDAKIGTGDEIRADMPGTVVACHVTLGDIVSYGERLMTIESMKLQITVVAPRAGVVANIAVAENATFERGAVLVALAPLSGDQPQREA